jgi:hypothetical protein
VAVLVALGRRAGEGGAQRRHLGLEPCDCRHQIRGRPRHRGRV